MNSKTRKVTALVLVVLTLCLFSLEQTTSAQEQTTSARSNCHTVKGNLSDVSNPNGTTGTITNGGILNGTTELLFTSGVLSTPDPNTFSYTDDFTITTHLGQLKTGNVGIFDGGNGVFSEIGRINPNTSTGWFAGATGILYTSGKTTDGGATFQSRITGEICFANPRN
jgi:hypothetical protein